MKYLEFQQAFAAMPVIPVSEIERHFPGFDRNSLLRWQEKGHIHKLRNGFYRLQKPVRSEEELFLIAGVLYGPSYVSLESALAWHGLIPEGVFSITSVTHMKTRQFDTPLGAFTYRHLKKDLLFGTRLEAWGDYRFKIADPVKALLDFLYLRHDLKTPGHLQELRLNLPALWLHLETCPLGAYLDRFDSAVLRGKISHLQNLLP